MVKSVEKKAQALEGYFIHDCVILAPDYVAVSAEEELPEEEYDHYTSRGSSKICTYDFLKQKNDEPPFWSSRKWGRNSFFNSRLVNLNPSEYLAIDDAGSVFYGGLGENKRVEQKLPKHLRIENISKVGEQVYGVGFGRIITKRIGPDHWELMTESIQDSTAKNTGFYDLDGFDENDLYAVGGKNDIWHFDGEDWSPVDVVDAPFLPMCVCCAEDGYVYIGGAWGMIARGRGDEWETYMPESRVDKFSSVVSYQGRIFFGNESRVYVMPHNAQTLEYKEYDFEGQISSLGARRMDVGHGLMMFASLSRVALYDGVQWKMIYSGSPMPKEEAQVLEMMTHNAEETLDAMGELLDKLKTLKK
ncbi:hypothetical protein Q8W30_17750 [Neptunomonas phycophila]|uniref:Uncharacterized protein n=1 Tax=Neptunomonas phycophila TaxID=1572645 RepID=A0ABT9EZD0_9GAMM|nr:hypothetical protein [Neptunomonas phycophila]MDO6469965.1 hypothetical protein [Neptunomonas phycophila]MDP2524412.1 hypothetical protein [Neptunomonas phycophila]